MSRAPHWRNQASGLAGSHKVVIVIVPRADGLAEPFFTGRSGPVGVKQAEIRSRIILVQQCVILLAYTTGCGFLRPCAQ